MTCADPACRCHTDPAHRVLTPFPLDSGPPYCCNLCARLRWVPGLGAEPIGIADNVYRREAMEHLARAERAEAEAIDRAHDLALMGKAFQRYQQAEAEVERLRALLRMAEHKIGTLETHLTACEQARDAALRGGEK